MFLVATTRSVLYVREDNVITPVDRGKGLYYGLAKSFGKYYVACRNSDPTHTNTFIPPEQETGDIMVLDNKLRSEAILQPEDFKLQDLHGIGFWNGKLLCTSSYGDYIAIYDGEKWDRWQPIPPRRNCSYRDSHHLNTVYGTDNRLYILAHNWDNGSFILEFDGIGQPPRQIHTNMGIQCHDLWLHKGDIYTLSSKEGCVRSTGGFVKNLGGWVRGFAHVDDHFWVGASPTAKRSDRAFGDGIIRKYDEDWNQVGELVLEDEGQVLAILDIGRKASNPQLSMLS